MILDASVILKWFMQEDDSEKAGVLKEAHIAGKFNIAVPDIAIYEVANALRYEPEFFPEEVNRSLEELYELNLDIIAPLPDVTNLAIRIAYEKDITFYDAFYIALAKQLGFQYVTADKKLYEKVKSFPFVNILRESESLLT